MQFKAILAVCIEPAAAWRRYEAFTTLYEDGFSLCINGGHEVPHPAEDARLLAKFVNSVPGCGID